MNEKNVTPAQPEKFSDDQLDDLHGPPIDIGSRGGIYPNQVRLAAGFVNDNLISFDKKRGFLSYDKATGTWPRIEPIQVKLLIAKHLREYTKKPDFRELHRKINNDLLSDLLDLVQGLAAKDFNANHRTGILHFKNGMVDTTVEPFQLLPFAPEYCSTRQIPYDYEPKATCPRYEAWLNETMDPEDQLLWMQVNGMFLSGLNSEQRIVLLTGLGGTGKGQHVAITRGIIGDENCFQIETKNFSQRFELNKLIDKSLLIGSDVSPDFLSNAAAHYLKSLTGDDLLSAELKFANGSVMLSGNFNVVMVSNSKLRVRLAGDLEAWRRRLAVIQFDKLIDKTKRVPFFAKTILQEEASGIINLFLEGLRQIRRSRIQLTPIQQARVDELLGESDSVRSFVEEQVLLDPDGDVTTDELVRAHERFCQRRNWIPRSPAVVQKELQKVMLDVYGVTSRHDICRGSDRRGFSGFALGREPVETDVL